MVDYNYLSKTIQTYIYRKEPICSTEFQNLIKSFRNNGNPSVAEAMYDWAESYLKGAKDFMDFLVDYFKSGGKPLYNSEMEDIFVEFAKRLGEVKEISE